MAITKIAQVDVGSGGATSIDFTAIPGTYTDLVLVASVRSGYTAAIDDILIRINGANTNLTTRSLYGSGSAAQSFTNANFALLTDQAASATASTFINSQTYFPNYSGSTQKPFSTDAVSENNATAAYQHLGANLWASTAAITGISIFNASGYALAQYSSATLYGISKTGATGASVA